MFGDNPYFYGYTVIHIFHIYIYNIYIYTYYNIYNSMCIYIYIWRKVWLDNTSSTAQGGGGSFKNRKPIGEVGCCESGMAERIH